MTINVIEPITHYIKEFDTTNDFDSWYKAHQDDMDKLTTHKLNKMYHINGYRITRIKGQLMLKKARPTTTTKTTKSDTDIISTEHEQRFIAIESDIAEIYDDIKNIKIALQTIEQYFKNLE